MVIFGPARRFRSFKIFLISKRNAAKAEPKKKDEEMRGLRRGKNREKNLMQRGEGGERRGEEREERSETHRATIDT